MARGAAEQRARSGLVSTTFLLLMFAAGATTAWLAARKGYKPGTWFWLGALLGLIALTVLWLERPVRRHAPNV